MSDTAQSPNSLEVIQGIGVVPGVVYQKIAWVKERSPLPEATETVPEGQREQEYAEFQQAVDTVASRLDQRAEGLSGHAQQVLAATAAMTRDRAWGRKVKKAIDAGQSNLYAVRHATKEFTDMFTATGGVMVERVTDLNDVRDRVLAELRGEEEPGIPVLSSPHILCADDLAPADTATLDPELIVGIVTAKGGATSHTAIIARQLDIPCVVAAGESLKEICSETLALLDSGLGTLTLGADPVFAEKKVQEAKDYAELVKNWKGPAQTKDGHGVQLLANVQDGAAAEFAATESVAEGIGLFRTELLFLSSAVEPSVEEQAQAYAEVLSAFPEGKVVIRTLDAGSDKPVPFVDAMEEENPALGVRGLRIARDNNSIMTRQLDAIALAVQKAERTVPTWVMAPMVATVSEAKWFAELCRERGLVPGAMVEVPAVALMADRVMPYLDFVSLGTNDLTQYTMAADRLSSELAYLTNPWQPAVLRLIKMTCEAGQSTDTPVGVCGEAAADPVLACVLTGLGVKSLSSAAPALSTVGVTVGSVTLETCKKMADAAINSDSASLAKEHAQKILDDSLDKE